MNQLLSDDEITLIVRECARGSAINRDGSTSHRIAKTIEAKIMEKLRDQNEPIAYINVNSQQLEWAKPTIFTTPRSIDLAPVPLYMRPNPAPIPDGYVLVPVEPTEDMVHAGHVVSRELIGANVAKSMHGLGGGKTWKEFKPTCKYPYLCEQYVSGDIDSTQAIYMAMLAAARMEK